jgi:integrase
MCRELFHPLEQRENYRAKTTPQATGYLVNTGPFKVRKRYRDLALFNLAIDSKLRACDLVKLKISDVVHGESVLARASVIQQKTGLSVRFEITDQTRAAVDGCC